MSIPFLGEACALLTAVTWAFALVLFKRSGESIPPLSLSLFKNVVGIAMLLATLWIVGERAEELRSMHPGDVCILILSGVLGIAIADTILFYSLNMIGVGLITIMECAYTPSVMLFAWLLIFEHIGAAHFVGGALVLVGVIISSTHKPPPDRTRAQLLFGMFLGALAVSMMAAGIVAAKPILETTTVLTGSTIRLTGGTLALAAVMAASPQRARLFTVFRPAASWRYCVPGSIFGTYFAMIFWIGGYKWAQASVAAILNQTSTIIALVLAAALLDEPFTPRKAVAAVLALSGVTVVTLGAA